MALSHHSNPLHPHLSKDLPGRPQTAARGRVVTMLVLLVIFVTVVGSYLWYAG